MMDASESAGTDGRGDKPGRDVWTYCATNCRGRCALKLHVVGDRIESVGTYARGNADGPDVQPRACLRGRAIRDLIDHPDRLDYPLRRVPGSKRGEGAFERISWDEAVNLIVDAYRRIVGKHGQQAVYLNYGTGASATTARVWERLFSLLGGYTGYYGTYSDAQYEWIIPYLYGDGVLMGSTISAATGADLVLLFGASPVETSQGGAIAHRDFAAMREACKGKMYIVDPRLNDSLAGHATDWIPIRPGTDAALVSAIAHELVANDAVDIDFLHEYCVGFDERTLPSSARGRHLSYRDYLFGTGYDCIEKTPEWAARISGVPARRIVALAREIADAQSVFVAQGMGPQRRSNGEMTAAALCLISVLTGNIGLAHTSNGLRIGERCLNLKSIPSPRNPVEAKISMFSMVDAIKRGHEMTARADGVVGAERLPCDIGFVFNYAGNCITNQNGDINWVHDVLQEKDGELFIAGSDIFMTDSLKYCDVILPDLMRQEQASVIGAGGDEPYLLAGEEPYPPKFERKSSYDAAALIARAFGKEDEFTQGKSQLDWIQALYDESRAEDPELPMLERAREEGVWTRSSSAGPLVALEAFRKDPAAHPLNTPSGKIEIYSERLALHIAEHDFLPDDVVAPIPIYAPEWPRVGTPGNAYPLQLMGFHYRGRTHSSWGNVDSLKQLNPQELWINPHDARGRGIAGGDRVRVWNDFGAVELVAKVTPRIVPGTVAMPQGAWHEADMWGSRVDVGGCINTLTTHRPSPLAKGNPQHTNVCQVARVETAEHIRAGA